MKNKFLILIAVVIIIFLVVLGWWNQALKPANINDSKKRTFTVLRGENSRTIAEKLTKEGIIRSPVAFFLLARFGGYGAKFQSGDFALSPSMNLKTVTENLTHGTSDIQILIKEGLRNEEIAMIFSRELNIPESDFLKNSVLGKMFPDTYLIPKDSTAVTVAQILLSNFEKKVTPDIIALAKNKGLDEKELLTVASLVEREAKFDKDRGLVASVILNRLKIGMKLDIDATVQYALGYQTKEKTWWKKELTGEDLDIDSPYNTYKNPGLPPSPICNMGLAVINAVVNAPSTDYLYYLSDETGKTYFSKDLDEHNANIKKYLNK